MHVFWKFIIFLFSRQKRIVHIRAARKKMPEEACAAKVPTETMLKHRIVLVATCVMSLALLISLTAIVVFLIVSPDKDTPIILRDVFFGTLGYFGGAFVSFLNVDLDTK